jgi:haloacetate dehalogenase
MKISSRTVHANGIRQHYLAAGDGSPVVLLDSFPETSYAWRYQIPELAKKHHVIAPDLGGYGETDKSSSGYDKRNGRVRVDETYVKSVSALGAIRGAMEDYRANAPMSPRTTPMLQIRSLAR